MKKRPYRAETVKMIDVGALAQAVRSQPVVVGLDVAKEKMVAVVMNEARESLGTVKWTHPLESPDFVVLLKEIGASSIQIAVEPSGTYGDALMDLLAREWPVFVIPGKRTHDAQEVFDGVPSTHDGKCASIIAKLRLQGIGREWELESTERRELKAATATLRRYEERFLANTNRLEAELARYWPGLSEILQLGSATALSLLAAYPGPRAVADHADEAATLMRKCGGTFLSDDTIAAVINTARSSLGRAMVDGEREALRELAKDTEYTRLQCSAAEKRVKAIAQASETVRNSRTLVGEKTAAILVATLGETQEYDSAGAYMKAFGLNLREHSSGRGDREETPLRITKRGPSAARQYLFFAALRLIHSDEVVRAWYAQKVVRDGGKRKLKGVIAVMRKLVKALWHVGRGAKFDSTKLFDVSRLNVQAKATGCAMAS